MRSAFKEFPALPSSTTMPLGHPYVTHPRARHGRVPQPHLVGSRQLPSCSDRDALIVGRADARGRAVPKHEVVEDRA